MKKAIYLCLVLLLVSCGNSQTTSISSNSTASVTAQSAPLKVTAQSVLAAMEKGKYVEGQLLVKFKSGVVTSSSLRTHQVVGATSLKRFSAVPRLEHVKLPAGLSVKAAVVRYMSDPNVEYAEPNYIRRAARVSNDPFFANHQQWALQNTGTFANGTAGADINAPGAWDTTIGSEDVIIAILDTGVDYTHHDLEFNNIWRNTGETNCADGIDNDNNGFIDDCKGWDFTTCSTFDPLSPVTTASAVLSGAQEVPPVATAATGSAELTVNFETGAISGTVDFSGLGSNATEAHIHQGAAGTNGSVIVSLTGGAGATSGTWTIPGGTSLTTNQLTQLKANGLYVNVHSTAQPDGEIRGQIVLSGVLACITPKESDNDPMDDFGHGTHVAGIIGADGDNGIGSAGVMWRVKLLPLKFLNADGFGQLSDELEAIDYVVENVKNHGVKIKAINASFGGSEFSAAERDAIITLNDNGVLFIAAAGNSFNNNDLEPVFPAGYSNPTYGGLPNIISVAATDQQDRLASFSGFGLSSVQLGAPGVYILSTVPGGYDFFSGTSMAAPHVAGVAGLLYSHYDGIHNTVFNQSQVRATILRYVDVLPTLNGWIQTGGRINAFRAVSSLLSPTNLTASALPTQITLTWADNATGEDGYRLEKKGPTDADFVDITAASPLPPGTTTFIDSGVSKTKTYQYRVRAFNNIANSFYSNTISVTTPEDPPPPTGGGGGCSIGSRQNTPTAVADFALLLAPLMFIAILRRIRK
jgi:subtilisin family serine protease